MLDQFYCLEYGCTFLLFSKMTHSRKLNVISMVISLKRRFFVLVCISRHSDDRCNVITINNREQLPLHTNVMVHIFSPLNCSPTFHPKSTYNDLLKIYSLMYRRKKNNTRRINEHAYLETTVLNCLCADIMWGHRPYSTDTLTNTYTIYQVPYVN